MYISSTVVIILVLTINFNIILILLCFVMIISLQKYASNMLIIFCRMALPHLLEHYYEENHRGRRIAAGAVIGFAGLSLFSTMLYCTNEQFAFVQVLPLC